MIRAAVGLLLLLAPTPALAQTARGPVVVPVPAPSGPDEVAAAAAEAEAILARSEPQRLALLAALENLKPEAAAISRNPDLSQAEKRERVSALLARISAEIAAIEAVVDAWGTARARQERMTPEQTAVALEVMQGQFRQSLVDQLITPATTPAPDPGRS